MSGASVAKNFPPVQATHPDSGFATGDLFSGGIAMAGGIAGAIATAKQARAQRKFQERMFRNRYQYTMQDMEAAGLNPILAYKQGGGSAPSGAMANIPNATQAGVAAAQQNRMDRRKLGVMNQQRAKELQMTNQIIAATNDIHSAAALKDAKTVTEQEVARLTKQQRRNAQLAHDQMTLGLPEMYNRARFESTYGWNAMLAERGGKALGAVATPTLDILGTVLSRGIGRGSKPPSGKVTVPPLLGGRGSTNRSYRE